MATLTIVLTYSGSAHQEEVSSYTSGGTAFASLTAVELATAVRLMKKAVKQTSGTYGQKLAAHATADPG